MPDQVDDASLNDRLWEHGIDGLGKALQAVDDRDENILRPAGLELVHDAQPEFGALGLFDPDAENILGAIRQNAECDVDRLESISWVIAISIVVAIATTSDRK